MKQSNKSFNRMPILTGLVIVLLLQFGATALYASDLTQVRCHRYEEGGKPVKVRLSLDFDGKPEKLSLQKSDDPLGNAPSGYVEDFVIVTEVGATAISPVNIKLGNAKGTLNIKIEENTIHVAILKGYELQASTFNYLDEVAYIDMKIAIRTEMPEPKKPPVVEKPPEPVVTDTVYIEKIIHDTVYIEIGTTAKSAPDTVYIDRIVYVEKEEELNSLKGIRCENFLHWWNDPHIRISFFFKDHTEKFEIKESTRKLKDIPAGYDVKYVIEYTTKGIPPLFTDVNTNYVRSEEKILLWQAKDKCYILAREGIDLKPRNFGYDENNRLAFLRLTY